MCERKLKAMSNHFSPCPVMSLLFPVPPAKTKLCFCPSTPGTSAWSSIPWLVAALTPQSIPSCLARRFYFLYFQRHSRCHQGRLAACLSSYCSTHWEKISLLARVWVPEQINRDEKWCAWRGGRIREGMGRLMIEKAVVLFQLRL